jgi:hypothetical protein
LPSNGSLLRDLDCTHTPRLLVDDVSIVVMLQFQTHKQSKELFEEWRHRASNNCSRQNSSSLQALRAELSGEGVNQLDMEEWELDGGRARKKSRSQGGQRRVETSWMEREAGEFPRPPKDTHNGGGRGSPAPQPRKPAGQFFSTAPFFLGIAMYLNPKPSYFFKCVFEWVKAILGFRNRDVTSSKTRCSVN